MTNSAASLSFGVPPTADEVEVSVFGPGYGESIALHVGENKWILVDSCIPRGFRRPVVLDYLQALGVGFERVQSIVATHWHDDHVRGLSALRDACPSAAFYLSSVFNSDEARSFVAAYNGRTTGGLSRATSELFNCVADREHEFIHNRSLLYFDAGLGARVLALTPLSPAFQRFIQFVEAHLPSTDRPHGSVSGIKPNGEAVVLHVQVGELAVVLGSDLEEHSTYGWSALAANSLARSLSRGSVLKVPHHGSEGAHHDSTWTVLLDSEPISVTTPFWNGRLKLPTVADRKRIAHLSKDAFITSAATSKPQMPKTHLDRLRSITSEIVPINVGFGGIRARRRQLEPLWRVDLFGSAGRV